MSTRCNIKIVTTDDEGHTQHDQPTLWLYHHHDGYPEGVGRELFLFLNGNAWWCCGAQMANALLRIAEPLYECESGCVKNDFKITTGEHGDIEYLYEIIVGGGRAKLRCWERRYSISLDEDGMPEYRYFVEIDLSAFRGFWETEKTEKN